MATKTLRAERQDARRSALAAQSSGRARHRQADAIRPDTSRPSITPSRPDPMISRTFWGLQFQALATAAETMAAATT